MARVDPVIRLAQPADFKRIGDLVVDAYAALGDLGGYESVLRDVADRSGSAEVAVAGGRVSRGGGTE
jgi:hypothetical protein